MSEQKTVKPEQDTAEQELKAILELTRMNGIPNVETDTELPPVMAPVMAPESAPTPEAERPAVATATPTTVNLNVITPSEQAPAEAAIVVESNPVNPLVSDVVWHPEAKAWVQRSELPVAPPRKRSRVAIVGFAPHWFRAPFDDEDVEIWTLNEFYDVGPNQIQAARQQGRLRWFEIHIREAEYEGNPFMHSRNKSTEHAAKLAALGCPVYMQRHWDDIPGSVPYPLGAITQKYGRYFTNSISWMIALAIEEGFTEIGLYGVDMATTTEYGYERPSCEFFLGWLKALGIRLVMPDECDLIKSAFLYGFESDKASFARAKLENRVNELRGRRHNIENQMEGLRNAQHQLIGAEENTKYLKEILIGNFDPRRAPQAQ